MSDYVVIFFALREKMSAIKCMYILTYIVQFENTTYIVHLTNVYTFPASYCLQHITEVHITIHSLRQDSVRLLFYICNVGGVTDINQLSHVIFIY